MVVEVVAIMEEMTDNIRQSVMGQWRNSGPQRLQWWQR